MSERRRDQQVVGGSEPERPAYEPPAVVWEEDFEPVSGSLGNQPSRYGPNAVNQLMGCDQVG